MAQVLERARRDLSDGQLWRARHRLEGFVGSRGYDPNVIEMLGDICHRMGDSPAAGRFWFFSNLNDDAKRHAVETFVRQAGGDPHVIASRLPRRLRSHPLHRYPVEVQRRLRSLVEHSTKRGTIARQPELRARGPRRSIASDMLAFSALSLIGLFCLYCFSVGLAHLLALN